MVTDGNQTYNGDHFEMYRNTESLCCITGTNIVLQVNYIDTSIKLIEKDQICGQQGKGVRVGGFGCRQSKGTNFQL